MNDHVALLYCIWQKKIVSHLEIWSVLLHLGVVHVNCEKLKHKYTHIRNKLSAWQGWTLRQDNSRLYCTFTWRIKKYACYVLTLYCWLGSILFQGSGLFLRSHLRRQRHGERLSKTDKSPWCCRRKTYETSGFFRASLPKYNILMVAPPPMKMNRGISCWETEEK